MKKQNLKHTCKRTFIHTSDTVCIFSVNYYVNTFLNNKTVQFIYRYAEVNKQINNK